MESLSKISATNWGWRVVHQSAIEDRAGRLWLAIDDEVGVYCYESKAVLWLLPRLEGIVAQNPDVYYAGGLGWWDVVWRRIRACVSVRWEGICGFYGEGAVKVETFGLL
ncbi:MAG: hypothetical protein U0176_18270 [Bacteroidia bacterium]